MYGALVEPPACVALRLKFVTPQQPIPPLVYNLGTAPLGVGRGSMRQLLSILLVVILCATSTYAAKPSASIPAQVAQKPTLQEKVLVDIPPGSRVQVRLKNKEKLRGLLGEVSNEGFVLQYARGNQIEKRIIGFDEVESIKVIKVKEGGRAWRVAKWILMAGGIYIVVLIMLASLFHGGQEDDL